MGIIGDLKAVKNIQRIKMGGTAKISVAQLTDVLINLVDAHKKLSEDDYNKIYEVYKNFKTQNKKMVLNMQSYVEEAIKIINEFDKIAPYEKYSGGNEQEFSFFMSDIRAKRNIRIAQKVSNIAFKKFINTLTNCYNVMDNLLADYIVLNNNIVEMSSIMPIDFGKVLEALIIIDDELQNVYFELDVYRASEDEEEFVLIQNAYDLFSSMIKLDIEINKKLLQKANGEQVKYNIRAYNKDIKRLEEMRDELIGLITETIPEMLNHSEANNINENDPEIFRCTNCNGEISPDDEICPHCECIFADCVEDLL